MSQPSQHEPGAFPHQTAYRGDDSRKRRLSMTGLILGGVLLALAVIVLLVLALLFVLGGGGDSARFAPVARGFLLTSATVGGLGAVSLVFGLITRK
ncbi:hypothetical protein [Kribbella sp. NPDC051770]|uniref:hypothetical protein n=1 Tax=Kribbella sp. NPDC051770 TaxID=3155413 RepID=UPI00341E813D